MQRTGSKPCKSNAVLKGITMDIPTIITILNAMQMQGNDATDIAKWINKYLPSNIITRLKVYPTRDMGDVVLIAIHDLC
jgi:hypothetical protein